MKVQRYLYGGTNVGQLQSGRAALRSPQEVAQEAAAPYQAVADVSKAISDGLLREEERQQKIQADEDAIQLKLMDEQVKLFDVQMKNDQRYDDQIQPDGTTTGKLMLEDYEEGIKEIQQGFEGINNEKTRANAEKLFEMTKQAGRLKVRTLVNDKSEAWNVKAEFQFRELSVAAGDYDDARKQTEALLTNDRITQDQYETDMRQIRTAEVETLSDEILYGFEQAHDVGRDTEFYAQVVDSDMDADVKAASITKMENQLGNYSRIQKKETALAKTALIETKTDMLVAIKTGQPMPMTIDEFLRKADAVGDPALSNEARGWRQEFLFAGIAGAKSNGDYQEFMVSRTNHVFLDNTTANQKHLQQEIEDGVVEGMSEEQVKQRAIDVQRDAGFLSFNAEQMFSTAKRDANYLAEIAPLWGELMLNPDINRSMDTDVEPSNQRLLTDTYRAMEAGVPPLEAAQGAIETSEMWEQNEPVMQARQTFYTTKNNGQKASIKSFGNLVGDYYDNSNLPFRGQGEFVIEGLGRDAQARYDEYFHTAFMQTNNLETAALQANLEFKQNHSMNNLNGEWNIELHGVKGNVNYIRKDYAKNNSGEAVMFVGDNGLTGSTLGDLDDLQFRNPTPAKNGKRYEVWNGDSPVMQDIERTVDGKKVVSREQVFKTVDTSEQNATELEKIRINTAEDIKELQEEYDKAAEHLKTTNPYGRSRSVESVRNVENKIRLAKENLAKEEARLSPDF